MKVTSERLADSRVQLQIEADEEASGKAFERAFRQLSDRVNIPGFRRGRAPRPMVERVLGRDYILREAAQIMLPDLYQQAVQEAGVDPMYDPDVDIISLEPLSVKIVVSVRPTVALPDYKSMRIPKESVTVTDEQVEEAMANLREQHAEWVPVERPVQEGDTAVIDAVAHAGEEKILEQSNIEYLVDPARGIPLAGFAEQVVGLKAGEEKDFTLTFPEDYSHADLSGKEAAFHATVHSVKEKHLPELDDEFAKTVGENDTLEALRNSLRERLQQRLTESADYEYEETVLGTVADQATVDMPNEMVEEQSESSLHNLEDRLQSQNLAMPEYLNATGQTRLQLLEGLRGDARAILRRQLVLNEVADAEGIEVPEAEVDAEIEQTVALFGQRADEARKSLDTPDSRRSITFRLRQRKARERLSAIVSQPAEAEAPAEAEQATASEAPPQEAESAES